MKCYLNKHALLKENNIITVLNKHLCSNFSHTRKMYFFIFPQNSVLTLPRHPCPNNMYFEVKTPDSKSYNRTCKWQPFKLCISIPACLISLICQNILKARKSSSNLLKLFYLEVTHPCFHSCSLLGSVLNENFRILTTFLFWEGSLHIQT